MRFVCSECGRSVSFEGASGGDDLHPCEACRGEGEGVRRGDGPSGSRTPGSLELTPEDLAAHTSTCDFERGLPSCIGRFLVRDVLGGGGFGQVYRVYDAKLERIVALKVLREARPSARVIERFFREARAAAQLDHPNIVTLHDAGRDEGRCWIAYQYVDGTTLHRAAHAVASDLRETVRIIRDLADALNHAHRRGVFHRDIKPANVLVDARGRPRLTDFGLARRVDFDPTMTQDGAILGTPAYMSPEAAAGHSHRADARSDLYSLGIMFYELLCGRRPTDAPSGGPSWRPAKRTPPPRPRSIEASIPRPIERICLRALALDPEDRYPDARSFAADLTRWLDGGDSGWRFARVGALAASLLAAVAAREAVAFASRERPAEPAAVPQVVAAPVVTAPPIRPIEGPKLVGNVVSMTYHAEGCRTIANMKEERRVMLADPVEAARRGFKPCKTCMKARTKS